MKGENPVIELIAGRRPGPGPRRADDISLPGDRAPTNEIHRPPAGCDEVNRRDGVDDDWRDDADTNDENDGVRRLLV